MVSHFKEDEKNIKTANAVIELTEQILVDIENIKKRVLIIINSPAFSNPKLMNKSIIDLTKYMTENNIKFTNDDLTLMTNFQITKKRYKGSNIEKLIKIHSLRKKDISDQIKKLGSKIANKNINIDSKELINQIIEIGKIITDIIPIELIISEELSKDLPEGLIKMPFIPLNIDNLKIIFQKVQEKLDKKSEEIKYINKILVELTKNGLEEELDKVVNMFYEGATYKEFDTEFKVITINYSEPEVEHVELTSEQKNKIEQNIIDEKTKIVEREINGYGIIKKILFNISIINARLNESMGINFKEAKNIYIKKLAIKK